MMILNLHLFICYSPILTRHFGSALHTVFDVLYIVYQLLVLANLLSLTSFEGEPPPPISTSWGAYKDAASHGTLTFKPLAITTCLSLVLEELEALWLGVNLMVHRWSLMCTNHIDMIAHTPAFFFTESGTTHIYVECSTAGPSLVSHYGAMPAGWSPIHVLTGLMIA